MKQLRRAISYLHPWGQLKRDKETASHKPNWHSVWISIVVSEALTVPVSLVLYGKLRVELLVLGFIVPLIVAPAMAYISYKRRMDLEVWRTEYRRRLEGQVSEKSAKLMESEKQYRAIFEHSPLGIAISDYEGNIKETNETFCKMLGYSNEDIRGSFRNITHPADIELNEKYILEMKGGLRDSFEMEKRYIRKDGAIIWGKLYIRKISDADGKYLYNLAMLEDITERVKYEREKMKARNLESLGVFAGGVAHDFNNMLAIILNNLSVVSMMQKKGQDVQGRLHTMQAKVHEARGMAQQLMTFAEGGAPVCRAVSVPGMLRDTVTFSLAGSGVRGRFDIPADIENVSIDPSQISQVINNIVLNAKEAMEGSGVLAVSTGSKEVNEGDNVSLEPGRYIWIRFCDTGPGIMPDIRERIFDPYYSTRDRGAGLGLAMAYSIMKKHRGNIEVGETGGEGACFTLHLPVTREAIVEDVAPSVGALRTGLNVLLMDDDLDLRSSTGELLELLGHNTVLVADGDGAIEAYSGAMKAGRAFDLVVLDLTVTGGMGGLEALEKLRAIHSGVRAVLSSGYSSVAPVEDYAALGFHASLVKPYTVDDINRAIETALGAPDKGA